MNRFEFGDVLRRLNELAEVYDKRPITETGSKVWFDVLQTLSQSDVLAALRDWAATKAKFPMPADIFSAANEAGIDRRDSEAVRLKAEERREVSEFFQGRTVEGKRAVALIRDMLATREKQDPKAWARRILDRYADGERIPHISLQYACEALGMDVDAVRASKVAA